jgi:hypothetical protein
MPKSIIFLLLEVKFRVSKGFEVQNPIAECVCSCKFAGRCTAKFSPDLAGLNFRQISPVNLELSDLIFAKARRAKLSVQDFVI